MKLTERVKNEIRNNIELRYAISKKVARTERSIYYLAYNDSKALIKIVEACKVLITKHTGLKNTEIFE
ncbi:hypothetical protein ETU09_05930 [Apibacter muscae]|uniref:Uncharacterized protein n=1 Tax=Apibacter muscae TaxID=2509004 RepID=A0A563DEA2_9FLAO|nr:hypothetical protein [Apibacter muscae]TWP28462.1 hypothetical protein ETU09_05930 [Apibacter muscae]